MLLLQLTGKLTQAKVVLFFAVGKLHITAKFDIGHKLAPPNENFHLLRIVT